MAKHFFYKKTLDCDPTVPLEEKGLRKVVGPSALRVYHVLKELIESGPLVEIKGGYWLPITYKELGEHVGITSERIRQHILKLLRREYIQYVPTDKMTRSAYRMVRTAYRLTPPPVWIED